MEKEIWKWILDSFPDEGIAGVALALGIKIPGFRQLNAQHKKFKIVRPKIIQLALHPKQTQDLYDFFMAIVDKDLEIESIKEKDIEELLRMVEEDLPPSILLGVLLSSEDEKDYAKAEHIFTKLKAEDKLDLLEETNVKTKKNENEEIKVTENITTLQEELKSAKQMIEKLEKKLKKFEQKYDELKSKEAKVEEALKIEKKRVKEEKAKSTDEINSLKGEIGNLKHQLRSMTQDREPLQKRMDQQAGEIKTKNDEINRLNALVLKLQTEIDKLTAMKDNPTEVPIGSTSGKIKVALIGDPKNTRIKQYDQYELTIIDGTKVLEEANQIKSLEQIWLLTYKVPKSMQNRVKALGKGKQMQEFATFTDLESYMQKGWI